MSDTQSALPESVAGPLEHWMDQLPALSIEEVVERTLTRTLMAATADDVLANPEAMGLEALSGEVVSILGISGCLPSRHKGGLSRYLVLDLERETTGEKVSVTCGSPYVVSRVFRLAELGALPARVRVLALDSSANPGQTSLWLVKP